MMLALLPAHIAAVAPVALRVRLNFVAANRIQTPLRMAFFNRAHLF
jgi:hypothetical protein